MPCRSDYMEPNERERDSRETATLLAFIAERRGKKVSQDLKDAAASIYGNVSRADEYAKRLCATVRSFTDKERETILYDGRSQLSRRLANWWEKHEEEDRKRLLEEERWATAKSRAELTLSDLAPEVRADVIEAIRQGLVK